MSEPDGAEIGRSIGDHSADIIADDAVACCAAAGTARPPDFARHQGEISHRGRQIQPEFRLDPTEVAGLPDAQLDQPGQSVLHYHPSRSILVVVGALLQGSGLLQHAFLGMDQHPSTLPALGRDALGAQRTYPTYRPVELESLQSVDTTGAIRPLSRRHDGAGNLPRRTGATARGQVKVKVIFGEVFPVGPARHFGHQPASRVGEGLAGPAVPIGGVAHGFLHHRAGTRFALLHQFQCPQIVGSNIMPVAGPCRGD